MPNCSECLNPTNITLIIFANSLDPDQARQNILIWIQKEWHSDSVPESSDPYKSITAESGHSNLFKRIENRPIILHFSLS